MGKLAALSVVFVLSFLYGSLLVCAAAAPKAHPAEDVSSARTATRKVDVDRQGGLATTLLAGPLAVGMGSLLFSLPVLPFLLLGPLAFAGLGPALGSLSDFIAGPQSGGSGKPSSGSSSSSSDDGGVADIAAALASLTEGSSSGFTPGKFQGGNNQQSGSSSSSSSSDSLMNMATSAIGTFTDLFFGNRRGPGPAGEPVRPGSSRPSASEQSRVGVIQTLKDIFGVLRTGLRRYEITESDCQARLICEVHQKALGRSFGSFTTTLLDLIGVETQLERSTAFGSRTKSYLREFVRAAKAGMSDSDCAAAYARCPSNIAIEPLRNSVFSNLLKTKQASLRKPVQHMPSGPIHMPIQGLHAPHVPQPVASIQYANHLGERAPPKGATIDQQRRPISQSGPYLTIHQPAGYYYATKNKL